MHNRLQGQWGRVTTGDTDVMESVVAEHVFLPVWLEEVSVVGIPKGVPDCNQPLRAKFPQGHPQRWYCSLVVCA